MKSARKTPLFGIVILAAAVGLSVASSFADGRRDRTRLDFELGVCVGQTLADQGTVLPAPTQGERYLNASDKQAIETAIETCREEFRGTEPSPTPSESPSQAPLAVPSVEPSS